MNLTGLSIIGWGRGATGGEIFHGINPASGETLPTEFHSANGAEVDRAARLAENAFDGYSALAGKERATFLRQIAVNIEAAGAAIQARGTLETGLPVARLAGETGRTTGQLRLFADLLFAAQHRAHLIETKS